MIIRLISSLNIINELKSLLRNKTLKQNIMNKTSTEDIVKKVMVYDSISEISDKFKDIIKGLDVNLAFFSLNKMFLSKHTKILCLIR